MPRDLQAADLGLKMYLAVLVHRYRKSGLTIALNGDHADS
jgi:hypothetical protein